VIGTVPPKEVVAVASVRRLVTKTPGRRLVKDVVQHTYTHDRIEVRLEHPFERCKALPAAWFIPADPPAFFTQPATVAEAVTV
jgi:hypothetical protein